jgi:hypothetical protein
MSVLYVYRCEACGHKGETHLAGDDHDGEPVRCANCGAAVALEWDGGVTFTADASVRSLLYDYQNQAWLENGRYVDCGHREPCDCYGRRHVGESAAADAILH